MMTLTTQTEIDGVTLESPDTNWKHKGYVRKQSDVDFKQNGIPQMETY
jgi:hypothetical protein